MFPSCPTTWSVCPEQQNLERQLILMTRVVNSGMGMEKSLPLQESPYYLKPQETVNVTQSKNKENLWDHWFGYLNEQNMKLVKKELVNQLD